MQLGIKEDSAERYARDRGLPWDEEVADRLEDCEQWHLKREQEKKKPAPEYGSGEVN